MPLVTVLFNPSRRLKVTDRAYRYRAVKQAPKGRKVCAFCGSTQKLMVGHLDGHEENTARDNLIWNCRSCNAHHANALKRSGIGRRTHQFNPTASGGAKSVGEWAQAVGAIVPHDYSYRNETLRAGSTMKTSDAVAMIRATPASARSRFAAQMAKHKAKRSRADDIPF